MERGGKRRGRGRARKTVEEMVNLADIVNTPNPLKTTGISRGRPRKTPQKTVIATDDDSNPSFPENSRKRGRQIITRAEDDELNSSFSKELSTDDPRNHGQDYSDTTDEDYSPKTTGRKRGRLAKTPQQAVNATDDVSNPSFPESSRKRRRQIILAEADELYSSFSKELLTDGPTHHVQDSGVASNHPSNLVMPVTDENVNSSHLAEADELNFSFSMELLTDGPSHHVEDSDVACNHLLPSNLVMSVTGENVNSNHHVQDSGVACNLLLPSNLVMSVTDENVNSSHLAKADELNSSSSMELLTDGPSHHVQDSGVACNHPLPGNLVVSIMGENVNSSHLAAPIDESENPTETEDDLCCPTKGKGVAAEPASETILQGNNVSDLLGDNIAKNSVSSKFSNPSKSQRGSSILRSKRSKDAPIVPLDSCEDDDHLPQTQVNVVAKDARITRCQSFNLTEVAEKIHNTLHDDDDDGEDIQSAFNPSLVAVKGYRVKPEVMPLLNQIFEQHGDIAKNCKVKGLQSCFLEKVCSVYEMVQNSSFQKIKRDELFEMVETLDGLEEMGLNVKWLSDRLYDILDVKVFLEVYAQKRKEFKKGNDHLITLEKAAAPIREKMSVLEREISKMKGEEEKVLKARNLLNSSLVDGLI